MTSTSPPCPRRMWIGWVSGVIVTARRRAGDRRARTRVGSAVQTVQRRRESGRSGVRSGRLPGRGGCAVRTSCGPGAGGVEQGGLKGGVGVDAVAETAQVVDGLAGAALSVAFWLGEPILARGAGERLELLAGEEPVGQVGGILRAGFGDVAVLSVGSEAGMVRQERGPFYWSAVHGWRGRRQDGPRGGSRCHGARRGGSPGRRGGVSGSRRARWPG